MRAGDVEPGDTLDGARVVAVWRPDPGWVAIQTADGRTAFAEDGQDMPGGKGPQPTLDVGLT